MSRLQRSDSRDSVFSVSSCVSGVGGWEVGDRAKIGCRSGTVSFIGPTKFAPGEWIGLTLDEAEGKNDGSVQGIRYFTCAANCGIFCKASKIERILASPAAHMKSPTPFSDAEPISPYAKEFGFDVGDRVIVSGGKIGILRFLDKTDFAQGVWSGVELDKPDGKNDGSVQGKRYFACKAPYGLFAPASKTEKAPNQTPVKLKAHHTKTSLLRTKRHGSRESLSSIGASSITSSRYGAVRRPVLRPNIIAGASGHEATMHAMQDAMKEKDRHLEQMMKERDLERMEMARIVQRCEELEQGKGDDGIEKMRFLNEELRTLKSKLLEKDKELDDLNFRLEEETIGKEAKIEELEKIIQDSEPSTPLVDNGEEVRKITMEMQQISIDSEKEKQSFSEKISQLEQEIVRLNEHIQLTQHTTASESQNEQVEYLQSASDAATDRVKELEEELATNMRLIDELNRKVDESSTAAYDQEKALSEQKALNENLRSEVDKLTTLIAKAKEESSGDRFALEEQLSNITAAKEDLESRLRSTEDDQKMGKEKLSMTEISLSEASSKILELEQIVTESRTEQNKTHQKFENDTEQLRATISQVEKSLVESNAKADILEKALSDEKSTNEENEKRGCTEKAEIQANLQKTLSDLEENKKLLENVMGEKGSTESCLNQRLQSLEKEKEEEEQKRKELKSNTDGLTKKISELEDCIQKRDVEIQTIRSTFSESESLWIKEKDLLEEKYSQLDKDLTEQRLSMEVKISELTGQLSEMNLKLQQNLRDIAEKDSLIASSQSKVIDTENELGKITQKSKETEHELRERVDLLENELSEKSKILSKQDRDHSEVDDQRKRLEEQCQSLSSELSNANDSLKLALSGKEIAETELRKTKDQHESLMSSVESFKLGGDQMAQDLAAAKVSSAEKNAQIEILQKQISVLEESTMSLESRVTSLSSDKDNLEKENKNKYAKHIEEIEKITDQIDLLTKEKTTLERTISEMNEELEKSQKVVNGLKLEADSNDSSLKMLKAKLIELEEEKINREKELSEASLRETSLTTEHAKLNSEITELRKNIIQLNKEKLESQGSLGEELTKLQSKLDEQIKQSSDEKKELEKKVTDFALARDEIINDSSVEKARLEQEISELALKLEETKRLGSNVQSTYESKVSELTSLLELATSSGNEQSSALQSHIAQLESKIEAGEKQWSNEKILFENRIAELTNQLELSGKSGCEQLDASTAQISQLTAELQNYKEQKDLLEVNLNSQISELQTMLGEIKKESAVEKEKIATELSSEKDRLENETAKLSREITLNVADLARVTKENEESRKVLLTGGFWFNGGSRADAASAEIVSLRGKLEIVEGQLKDKERELETERTEQTILKQEMTNAENSKVVSDQMAVEFTEAMEKIKSLSSEKNDLKTRIDDMKELETEIISLRSKEAQIEQREKEVKQKINLMDELDEEWRKKEIRFVEKIEDLSLKLEMAQRQTATEQNTSLQKQIDFLHSIIADKQKKEEKLKEEIQVLKSIPGGATSLDQFDFDVALNPTKKNEKPPRMFCDICEVFDVHDTEDCPTQQMELDEFALHSSHSVRTPEGKKQKPPPREYCDHCEEFGHDTSACPTRSAKKKDYTF